MFTNNDGDAMILQPHDFKPDNLPLNMKNRFSESLTFGMFLNIPLSLQPKLQLNKKELHGEKQAVS